MRFGSVCSGIEAASVAWDPLGWSADWFAEVEAFPSSVLAHRWPDVPNLGDMLALPDMVANDNIPAPDVLVGGTPCQAFSVAGRRGSLADERGALTLAYVELANEIDRRRAAAGSAPCIVVWENVPGVLSTKDNAFGCFLAGLAGESEPLFPAGGKWSNAGAVFGPARAVAWRILDAQYFGVAQRRRRVFVVASARDGFDPCQVLFERDGLRRDTAPSREKGQGAAADAGPGFEVAGTLDARTRGGGFPGSYGAAAGHVVPAGPSWPAEVASTLNAAFGKKQGLEDQHVNGGRPLFVPAPTNDNAQAIPILEPGARTGASTTDPRAGLGIGADGDPMFTLQAGKQHGVACAVTGEIAHTLKAEGFDGSEDGTGRGVPTIAHTVALRGRDGGATAELGGEVATALRASTGGGDKPHVLAFSSKDYGADAQDDLSPTLRAGGHADSHANAGVPPAVAFGLRSDAARNGEAMTPSPDAEGRVRLRPPGFNWCEEFAPTIDASQPHTVAQAMAVRRLTPRECERLQGFPDDHTLVPHRNKPAADGPRYKALGNSMAVPVMRWIGQRIDAHLRPANDR
jgi:DNA (cytosine-5)-methyltransferase 1